MFRIALVAAFAAFGSAHAGDVTIEGVNVKHLKDRDFRFSVTLRHSDEGWEHYADHWEVRDLDGDVLGQRPLAHPHDDEQPFTRSAVITVPEGLETVEVFARDTVHGWTETPTTVEVPEV